MRNNEQGRSMIEMLGVLAIVGVLSVGGIAGYSKAMNKFKTNKLIDQINMLATNIRTLYSSQRNYDGLTINVAVRAGVVPTEMYDGTASASVSSVRHAFGGELIVEAASHGTGDNNAYIIAAEDIPAASCVAIVTTDWGGDSGSGLVAMYAVSGDDATLDTVTGALTPTTLDGASVPGSTLAVVGDEDDGLPVSIVHANNACSSSSNSAIGWKYL